MNTKEINNLIVSNIGYAEKIAKIKKRKITHIPYDDLRSAAFFGLVQAANRFDPKKNDNFLLYAYARIVGSISDYLRELKWCKNNLEKKEVDFEMIQSRNVFISDNFTEDFEKLIGNVNIVKYKEILREYYLMGKNLQSIASQYNFKISMASQMLSSARDKLKTQLEKNQIN
jgi:RNA polymerase sigma factor (sigma-70 family)